jgi:Uma2 family endonuclease
MTLQKKAVREIYYPESDGEPMAETDVHRDLMAELISELQSFFQDQSDVYVSGNLLVYYIEGDPTKCFAPDVFVVRGIEKHERRIFKLWEEKQAPSVVLEISSRKTFMHDTMKKGQLYARLGISEYYLYDPEYDCLPEGLAAHHLQDGVYFDIQVKDGAVHSPALGLDLVDTGETLRLRDPKTGLFLPTKQEVDDARKQAEAAQKQAEAAQKQAEAAQKQAEARLQEETRARESAEAEIARLREELARLRSQE